MSSENETVDEIVKEMRDEWAQCYFSEGTKRKDGKHSEFPVIDTNEIADRFEAAHKREVAELRECLKEVVGCAEEFSEFLSNHPYLPKYLRDVIAESRKALEGVEDGK